jgi:hypothetical protein
VTVRDRPRDWSGVVGCGLLLLLVLAWAAYVPLRLPQRLGWQPSPAELLLGGSPDRSAAEALEQAAEAAGLGPQGVRVHVLTLAQNGERVAFTELDASKGYRWGRLLAWGEVREVLTKLATAGQNLDLDHLAVHYLSDRGQTLLTVTVPLRALQQFARGNLSSSQLLLRLRVNADLRQLAAEAAQ